MLDDLETVNRALQTAGNMNNTTTLSRKKAVIAVQRQLDANRMSRAQVESIIGVLTHLATQLKAPPHDLTAKSAGAGHAPLGLAVCLLTAAFETGVSDRDFKHSWFSFHF